MTSSSLFAEFSIETASQNASLRRDSKSRGAGFFASSTDGLKMDRPRDEGVGATEVVREEEPRVSPFLFLLGSSKDEARARWVGLATSIACSVGTRGADG